MKVPEKPKEVSRVTVNRYRSWIFRLFEIAVRRSILVHNPVKSFERAPETPRRRYLLPKEAATLLECSPPIIRPLVLLNVHYSRFSRY